MGDSWSRRAPLLGIAAIALIVASFVIGGDPPAIDEPVEEVVSFYEDNEDETGVGSLLLALGAVAFVLFYIGVAARLRRSEATVSALSIGVIAGAVILGVGMLIFAGIGLTLSDGATDLEPAALQALNALSLDLWFPVAGGTVVTSWCLGLAILRNGGLPRWLGWWAVIIGVASLTPAGFFAFLVLGLLTLVTSVIMLMQPEEAAPAA